MGGIYFAGWSPKRKGIPGVVRGCKAPPVAKILRTLLPTPGFGEWRWLKKERGSNTRSSSHGAENGIGAAVGGKSRLID